MEWCAHCTQLLCPKLLVQVWHVYFTADVSPIEDELKRSHNRAHVVVWYGRSKPAIYTYPESRGFLIFETPSLQEQMQVEAKIEADLVNQPVGTTICE